MSTILTYLKKDLQNAMKTEIQCRKTGSKISETTLVKKEVPRAIISMFPEIGIKPKNATNEDIHKLLKKYINQEKERAIYQLGYLKEKDVEGKTPQEVKKLVNSTIELYGKKLTNAKIQFAETYLPQAASKEKIIEWINQNIDFSQYKNKMQAMGPIMKQFKGNDGNFIKKILMKF